MAAGGELVKRVTLTLTSPIHKGVAPNTGAAEVVIGLQDGFRKTKRVAPNTDAAGGGCHRGPGRVSENEMKLLIPFAWAGGVKGYLVSTGPGVSVPVGKWVRS